MNNPEYAKVGDRKYKINTDYRVALECDEIARNGLISDYERALAIIYKLFGEEGLKNQNDYEQLLNIAKKYLNCGVEVDEHENETPNMDFKQDYRLIQASFKSDYGIVLENENLHWYDFYAYLNGLTDKCVLNRIRELRDFDVSQIKDAKEKEKIIKMKERFALKINEKPLTKEQEESNAIFEELMKGE